MRTPYKPSSTAYADYYNHQIGGGLPVYIGRGGLGSVLSGLFRSVVPIAKKAGKSLLKEGIRSGLGVAQDVLSGENIRTSVKRRARESGRNMLNMAIGQFSVPVAAPPGTPARRPIKRRRTTKKSKSSKDIFQ